MASGTRIAGALLIAAVAVGGLYLWQGRMAPTTADASRVGTPATSGVGSPSDGADAASSDPSATAEPQVPAQSLVSARNAPTNTRVGVQPLTAEQEQRLEAFVDATSQHNERTRDFETLVDNEAPDADWSDMTERRIDDALRRHGGRFTALHAGPAYCTRTVCRMLATGGFNSAAADADWQSLVGDVINDPALRDAFMDMGTTVQGDPKGLMYVTYLVRRTPGTR